MDSAVIRALCIELSDRLRGAKVKAVEQFNPWEFALVTDGGDLLVSCHQRFKRIVHTRGGEQPVSTHFARAAEDILRHSKVQEIVQRDLDRIAEVIVEKEDTLPEASVVRVVIEFVGSSGNAIVLASEGKVIVTLRRSRRNVVGRAYQPPKSPSGVDPSGMSPDELAGVLAKDKSGDLAESIQKAVMGFGPLLSKEIAFRAGLDPAAGVDSLSPAELTDAGKEILALHKNLVENKFEPTVYYRGDIPVEFSCFSLLHLQETEKRKCASMTDAVLEFHEKALVPEKIEERRRFLLQHLKRRMRSARARLAKQAEDLGKAKEAERYRLKGDAILANLGSITKGASSVTLENPEKPGETIEVELGAGKTPQDVAQGYFKKYKKLKKAVPVMQARLAESRKNLDQLENLKSMLDDAETDYDLGKLAETLVEKGIVQRPRSKRGRERKQYRTFMTRGGWEVIVGRSRQENDEITFHVAKPKDLFFHVSSASGSHTIMKVQGKGRTPGKKDIEEVAEIAAYYSKARTSRLVPVSYTERRYVRKPRKAPPGTVTVEREKTVMVEPRKPTQ